MSKEEIHDFGIEVVVNSIKTEGYEIIDVNTKTGINPQIVAKKDDQNIFIAVRTECYPNKGVLEESVHFDMIEHSKKHNAIPYFASVGIANSDGKTEEEMGQPIRGGGFYVAYEGLLIITTSDRVKIVEETDE